MPRCFYVSFVCFLFCFFIDNTYAQNRYTFPDLTPHSPNASSLGKYGEVPVSLNNGMANIAVPLFEVKVGSFVLPITLSYHNNGLKTNEIPSWAGLGWDISGFGVINIQQRGNADFADEGNGMFNSQSQQKLQSYLQNQMTTQQRYDYLEDVLLGSYDTEYDLYDYNFLGQSGTFYMDANQNIICVPKSNLKISKVDNGFTIVDERGNQYYFGLRESAETRPVPENELYARKSFSGTASYLLSRIITAENRTIGFGYLQYPFNYHTTNNYATVNDRPKVSPECPDDNFVTNVTNVSVSNYLLTNINFEGGSVQFKLSTASREDIKNIAISNTDFFPYLDRIQLLDDKGVLVNDFALVHSYFNGNARLKLDGITRTAANNSAENWQFEYYDEGSVPKIYGGSRDHWGYYNGNGSTYSIPGGRYGLFLSGWDDSRLSQVIRNSNPGASMNGMLRSITYPTGGKAILTYEPNQIKYNTYHEMTADPFLGVGIDVTQYIPPVYIVNESTTDQPTVTGEFTLTAGALVQIVTSRHYDPYNFTYSSVSLSTSPGGPDLIQQLIGWTCFSSPGSYCAAQKKVLLNAGTYYYKLVRNTDEAFPEDRGYAVLLLSMIPDQFPYPVPFSVGGHRIASIESISNAGVASRKRYEYSDLKGSLNFRNIPNYIVRTNININQPNGGGILLCEPCNQEIKVHDESVLPMIGNPVEYSLVTEYNDDAASNGKIEYNFSYTANLSGGGSSPYVTPFMATWGGGQLLNKKIYKRVGNGYDKVEEDVIQYESTLPSSVIMGFKAEYWKYCPQPGPGFREISITPENYQTERFSLKRSIKTIYDNTGNISQASENTYASTAHTLPTEVLGNNSKNEEVKQLIKYSFEYAGGNYVDDASLGIKALTDKNILAPVENLVIKKINGSDYVVSGKLMVYKSNNATLDKVYELAIKSPVLLSNITRSSINGNGIFIKDSRYEEKAIISLFDNFNNVLQQQYTNNVTQSFIYDYHSMYRVATVENADVASIAYSSFEAESGNWNITGNARENAAFTGRKSYQLQNGRILKTGLSAGRNYLVSYWTTNSNPFSINGNLNAPKLLKETRGWKCFEHTISGVTEIEIPQTNGIIDELRLCPAGAMMTTYTYDPLIGMTSQNDAGQNVTYYEYDMFNRLLRIRDFDKNILKQFEYQYQSNQTSGALWVATGNSRCKPCNQNSNYITNIRQIEEKDNNPNSSGYLSTRWVDAGWSSNCVVNPDWQNSPSAIRCKTVNNQYTGEQEQEKIDRNPCSNTYNNSQWVVTGVNCTSCPSPENWQPTGNTRCLIDPGNNQNTGYQEREERNLNANCGGQVRWINLGFRPEACRPPCYQCDYMGEGVSCVGYECEAGIKVYTNSYQQGNWIVCVYHYEYSNGSWSQNYTESSDNWCIL